MKKLICAFLFVSANSSILSQTDTLKAGTPKQEATDFVFVDEMPQFPGGLNGLYKYLQKEINPPKNAQGKVYLRFIVDSLGKIGKVEVQKADSICMECITESIRVVRSLPDFIPGKNNGRPVSVWYQLPINFGPIKKKK